MFKKLIPITFLFLCFSVNAQHVVSGTVYDENNNTINETDVELLSSDNKTIKTKTNNSGKYTFDNVTNGHYTLIIRQDKIKQDFQITVENQNLTFDPELFSSNINLESVNISKFRSAKSELEKKGFAVNVIETKEASVRNTQTLELLDQSVGVRIRQNGGLGSDYQFNINGMSGNSIRVFIDGIPMSSYGNAFSLNSIPPAMIERVEVFKGVVPGYLANDALGGAINIVLKNNNKNSINASISHGSFNTTQANFGASYRGDSGFTVNASMYYNYSDNDYKVWGKSIFKTNNDGTIEYIKAKRFNDTYYSYGSIAEVGYTNVKWADQFLIGYNKAISYKEAQHGAFMVRPYIGRHSKSDMNAATLSYKKRNFIAKGLDFNLHAIYTERELITNDTVTTAYGWDGNPILDLNGNPVRSPYGAQQSNATINHINRKSANVTYGLTYKINNHHNLSFNHLFLYQDRKDNDELRTVAENLYNENSKISKHNFALSYELSAFNDKLRTSFFGKYYFQNIERNKPIAQVINGQTVAVNQYSDKSTEEPGYGIAASYLLGESFMIMASAEKAIRMPEENEIFGNVADNQLDNFFINPEKSNNYNLGFKAGPYKIGELHKVSLAVNGFIRDTKDKITNVPITRNLSSPEATSSSNQLKTMSRGIDFEFNYSYKNNFQVFFNLSKFKSYMNDKNDSFSYKEQMPNEPFFTINTNAQYSFKDIIGKGSKLIVFYNYRFVDEFNSFVIGKLSGADAFIVPQQNIQDAGITYQFPNKHFVVSFDVKNIFDKQAFDNFGVQKPNRGFYVKLNYTL